MTSVVYVCVMAVLMAIGLVVGYTARSESKRLRRLRRGRHRRSSLGEAVPRRTWRLRSRRLH